MGKNNTNNNGEIRKEFQLHVWNSQKLQEEWNYFKIKIMKRNGVLIWLDWSTRLNYNPKKKEIYESDIICKNILGNIMYNMIS